MTILEGVSNFFQFLYSRLVYSWNIWSLLVITVGFFAIQVGFIYLYVKVFKVVFKAIPFFKYWVRRLSI